MGLAYYFIVCLILPSKKYPCSKYRLKWTMFYNWKHLIKVWPTLQPVDSLTLVGWGELEAGVL